MLREAMQLNPESENKIVPMNLRYKLIHASIIGVSLINGALYFAIAMEGGSNLDSLLHIHGDTAKNTMLAISVGASAVILCLPIKL